MSKGTIIGLCCIGAILLFYLPAIWYLRNGWFRFWYHDVLKWHQPDIFYWEDGCSTHATCKWCGKEVMQDSQGNWF